MAKNASNNVEYYVVIAEKNREDLANIRHWDNLKIGYLGDDIWIKNFDYVQINALEIKSLPAKTIYFAREGKLFLQNSPLPSRNIPSAMWTNIDRALPIKIPTFNHNYFGIKEKISLNLVPSDVEKQAVGMMTSVQNVQKYLETAPEIRLKNLKWTIINSNKIFLLGHPILPILGEVFWRHNDFLIPAGYDFDLKILMDELAVAINPQAQYWLIWREDSTYFKVKKTELAALSLGSFRRTLNNKI